MVFKSLSAYLKVLPTLGRTVVSHPKLREGYVFRPKWCGAALKTQKKVKRALRGGERRVFQVGRAHGWSRPRTAAEGRRNARRRARRLQAGVA